MTFERRSPLDELAEVRGGTANRRWQAAFELSRSIGRIPPGAERDAFAAETRRVFDGLSGKRPEDVKVRRYLVLVLGKLQDRAALPELLAAAKDPDPETRLYAVWALGMLGRSVRVRHGHRELELRRRRSEEDGRLRARQARRPARDPAAPSPSGRPGRGRALERGDRARVSPRPPRGWTCCARCSTAGRPLSRRRLSADQSEVAMVSALQALAILRRTRPAFRSSSGSREQIRIFACARRRARQRRRRGELGDGAGSRSLAAAGELAES